MVDVLATNGLKVVTITLAPPDPVSSAVNFSDITAGAIGYSKSVVGIVEVIREARQDSTTTDTRWQCVQIKALKSMNAIVHLHQIKTQPELNGMMLVNNPRLSVQPVKEHEWKIVCSLGGVSP